MPSRLWRVRAWWPVTMMLLVSIALTPLMFSPDEETLGDWYLYPAFVGSVVLLLMYLFLQPWWRSVFGISYVLILTTLVQMLGRSLLTLWMGDTYPAREWVLLFGRLEIWGSTWASVLMLMAYARASKIPEGPQEAISGPNTTGDGPVVH